MDHDVLGGHGARRDHGRHESLWSAREIAYGVELSEPKLIVADGPRRELLGAVDVPVLSTEVDIPRCRPRSRARNFRCRT
ncbi:hypothetical protein GS888_24895 [Rhodococcus hoagii]|nr:hypothetical protein [Prescottella equi]